MKSIIKMAAAIAIAAVLCIVPLFAIEDSDAARMEEGDAGLSVSIGSLSNADTDKLLSTDDKNLLAWMALAHTTDQTNLTGVQFRWTLSDVVVRDVKDLKESRGTSVTSSRVETVYGSSLECTVSFTATAKMYSSMTPNLFELTDGTQDLYNFIGSRTAPVDATLEVTGTLIKEDYNHSSSSYFKAKTGEICGDSSVSESSYRFTFSGDVKYSFTQAGTKTVREYKVETKSSEDFKTTTDYDYGKVSKDDIVSTTQVFVLRAYDKQLTEREFRYVTEDDVKGGYRSVTDLKSAFMPTGEYNVTDAGSTWVSEDVTLPEYHYYGDDDEYCLFTDAQDESLKSDSGMGSFLKSLSDSKVSDSYSDVKSVADSTATSIDSSSGGSNNLLLIAIIVVAVILIAAVAFMLLKKKEPQE